MNDNKHEASDKEKRTIRDSAARRPVGETAYDKLMSAYVERRFCDGTGKHESKNVKTLSEIITQKANRVVELVKKVFK